MYGSIIVFLSLTVLEVVSQPIGTTDAHPPNIITRAQWGARSPTGSSRSLTIDPAPYVILHHSDTPGCMTKEACKSRVKSFQNYHIDQKGWNDIGYNFIVGEDGNVYEGRGWSKHGAHSVPYNAKSIGICIIGNFKNSLPNEAAITAAQKLMAYGVAIGKIQENYTLYGHRQTMSTNCPGNSLYKEIQSWLHWKSKK